ncbi:Holliday junction resolvase RuvX [Candidatus Saccharibacteria bacterium]|nr:Holliday junction resolvase RuvX [Candidatus Saccharibacteria bacterium]NCS83064.1 Holliday junction resolvase RuvX [Candidatus Saccharibacteria bacterium]
MNRRSLVSLDVGEKRIGVSVADLGVRIAIPFETIMVDGSEIEAIARIVEEEQADTLVVGYPRNQSGEATAQTRYVEQFAKQLEDIVPTIVYQDESLTSVLAEERLKEQGKPYTRADIDAQAASIILQDYLEEHHG